MFDQAVVQDALGNDVLQCAIANVAINPRSTQIADHARSRLRASPYLGVRTLDCEYHEGVLVLRGQVATNSTSKLPKRVFAILPMSN